MSGSSRLDTSAVIRQYRTRKETDHAHGHRELATRSPLPAQASGGPPPGGGLPGHALRHRVDCLPTRGPPGKGAAGFADRTHGRIRLPRGYLAGFDPRRRAARLPGNGANAGRGRGPRPAWPVPEVAHRLCLVPRRTLRAAGGHGAHRERPLEPITAGGTHGEVAAALHAVLAGGAGTVLDHPTL